MQFRIGYEFRYRFPQPTPCLLALNIHHTRVNDLVSADHIQTSPPMSVIGYRDGYGNWCSRLIAPAGIVQFSTDVMIRDHGNPDPVAPHAGQIPVELPPDEAIVFLLASRFCESDKLLDLA